jgi:hypothetical protein
MAVYGSLTAGDSALHAISTSYRIPNAASCSRVGSNPIPDPVVQDPVEGPQIRGGIGG